MLKYRADSKVKHTKLHLCYKQTDRAVERAVENKEQWDDI
jgi:hypothetical protein